MLSVLESRDTLCLLIPPTYFPLCTPYSDRIGRLGKDEVDLDVQKES